MISGVVFRLSFLKLEMCFDWARSIRLGFLGGRLGTGEPGAGPAQPSPKRLFLKYKMSKSCEEFVQN